MGRLARRKKDQYTKIILNTLAGEDINKFRKYFLALHPQDQIDIFTTLNHEQRIYSYHYLEPKEFAELFSALEINDQKMIYLELDEAYSTSMFNHMFTDDIVMFLAEINSDRVELILEKMEINKAKRVRNLMAYAEETAGSIMTTEFIHIATKDRVEYVLERLREEAPSTEVIYYLYVVDSEQKLVGVVSLRDLIIASPDEMVEDIMSTKVISVPEEMDQEDVGRTIKKYDFLAIPVTSQQNHLLGLVTVDDIMDILEEETTEDIEDLSATKGSTDLDLTGFESAKKRAPWIVTLMFLGLVTGSVIGYFEETLEAVVLLSVFIPVIMDSAGNVGTQSLTVAVRGIALGTLEKGSFMKIIKRELTAGFYLGLISMVSIILIISVFYQSWILAVIIGISLFLTLTVSTVVGFVIPLIINKLKFDPAIASGPFITTINDIVGLVIYFSIATLLMDFL